MSSELPVVLPGREVGAHGVLALLPQDLLYECRFSHMDRQDGAKARLPHRAISVQPLHLPHETKAVQIFAGYKRSRDTSPGQKKKKRKKGDARGFLHKNEIICIEDASSLWLSLDVMINED